MTNHHLPSHLITTRAHWDAMADAIGELEAEKLYGPRPELYNSAESVERLYFAHKAPRRALWLAIALAVVLAVWVPYKALQRAEVRTEIEPCALVLTRESGPECR